MSPRAAWRLESWGYEAYDYVSGKMDWLSFGLPHEGEAVLAGDAVTRDVPTCGFRDPISDVRDRLEGSPYGMLVALNADGVVMGLVGRDALDEDDATVDDVMQEGPTTVRPSEELEGLLDRMERADVDAILVTSSDGRFLGVLERGKGTE